MDSPILTLEGYNIPAVGIILIEENNLSLTVSLPTGHTKVYTIAKGNTIKDLKERISVGNWLFLLMYSHPSL